MNEIFNSSAKPFYRFGDIVLLPKIEAAKWTAFITESFKFLDPAFELWFKKQFFNISYEK